MKESDAKHKACHKDLKYKCLGSGCVAWTQYEKEERKVVNINIPVPEKWEIVPNRYSNHKSVDGVIIEEHEIITYHKTDEGECGALPKEHGCFYPS